MRRCRVSALWAAAELAAALGGARGWDISGISIDTRTLQPGDLFVALQAERDGHDFVAAAFAKGAAAALVSRPVPGNVIVVPDTLRALERLGAASRARCAARIVAVTGSVGKTTAKEMLRRTLSGFGAVHAAEASFNNHIGVPLTLARMPKASDFGVFEIGMNHPGEIAPLAALVRPDVAMITCVDRAHLGLMGSEEAIAREKASIFSALVPGGTAVIPGNSGYLPLLRAAVPAGCRAMVFDRQAPAEAHMLQRRMWAEGSEITASVAGIEVNFLLATPGEHMAMNAVGVLSAASALGLDIKQAAAALDGFTPYKGRGERREVTLAGGAKALLLDESYNASGASMRAALAVLKLQRGRRVAVLGDMLELGEHAAEEHLRLYPSVEEGADIVFTCGPNSRILFDSLPRSMQGAHAETAADLASLVKAALRDGDVVLVKGSYGSRMRDVISALESPG
jgi:UDP-N-acetylmuramoyl-tripeptide--D-alanyl-D-alanine ligase